MNKIFKGLLLTGITLFAFLCLAGMVIGLRETEKTRNQQNDDNNSPPIISSEPEYVDLTIASVGDILIHNTLYYAAYDPSTKTYDFSDQFKHVKPLLMDADVTIANLETTLAGSEKGYSSYPKFNTPDSIMDVLKNSGVDIVTAANNHRMDTGISGFYRTIKVVREKGLDIIGVKSEENEKTYVIKDIKGVKVAFLNFGYAYPQGDGGLSVNGLILPSDMRGLLDSFDPQDIEQSTEALKQRITNAKEDGAQIIVVCLHWGDEYHRLPNDFQKQLTSRLVALGVNVIFGGHPHVLQPAVSLTSPEGEQVPVFYSQGNFISDQRKETVDDIYTEQGIIAKVTFRVEKGKNPQVLKADAIPTWVNKKFINNKYFYEVIPVQEALTAHEDLTFKEKYPYLNASDLERIRFCRDTVEKLKKELIIDI